MAGLAAAGIGFACVDCSDWDRGISEPCELSEIEDGGEHTAGAAVGVGKCKFAGGERTNDHRASWGRISAVCEYSAG